MKKSIHLFATLAAFLMLSQCNIHSKRNFVSVFEDDFESFDQWAYEVYKYDSTEQSYDFMAADKNVSGSTISLSANQGDDCDKKRIRHTLTDVATIKDLIENDTLEIILDITASSTSAMGANTFEIQIDQRYVAINIPEYSKSGQFKFAIAGWLPIQTESHVNDELEDLDWRSFNSNVSVNEIRVMSNACGADLWAGASIELDKIQLGYISLEE